MEAGNDPEILPGEVRGMVNEPTYDQLRKAFMIDMRAAGWRPLASTHGILYAWTCNHDGRRVVDDLVAFNHWKVTFSTPAQVLPSSVETVLNDETKQPRD
jgi:hypothetical protein